MTVNISKRDQALYQLALRIAADSDCADKHGTVIYRAGVILAVAANRWIPNPTSARWLKKTLHSEQRALLRVNAKNALLVTARIHAVNKQSAPCAMCRALIEEAQVAAILYHTGIELVKERL